MMEDYTLFFSESWARYHTDFDFELEYYQPQRQWPSAKHVPLILEDKPCSSLCPFFKHVSSIMVLLMNFVDSLVQLAACKVLHSHLSKACDSTYDRSWMVGDMDSTCQGGNIPTLCFRNLVPAWPIHEDTVTRKIVHHIGITWEYVPGNRKERRTML